MNSIMDARDPERIQPMLDLLEAVWREHPDWRLGQLVCNVASAAGGRRLDPFTVEDRTMAAGLLAMTSERRRIGGELARTLGIDPATLPKASAFRVRLPDRRDRGGDVMDVEHCGGCGHLVEEIERLRSAIDDAIRALEALPRRPSAERLLDVRVDLQTALRLRCEACGERHIHRDLADLAEEGMGTEGKWSM